MTTIPEGARNILSFISSKEAPRGAVDYFRGVKIPPPRPLTDMTINEVLAWQRQAVRAGSFSAAAGKFQIITKTLEGLRDELGLTGNEKFDEPMQDRMGFQLLRRRGWDRYASGQMTEAQFANSLAAEWAILPLVSGPKAGRSVYQGDGVNRAGVTPETILGVISGRTVVPTRVSGDPMPPMPPVPRPDTAGEGTPPAPGPFSGMIRWLATLLSSLRHRDK